MEEKLLNELVKSFGNESTKGLMGAKCGFETNDMKAIVGNDPTSLMVFDATKKANSIVLRERFKAYYLMDNGKPEMTSEFHKLFENPSQSGLELASMVCKFLEMELEQQESTPKGTHSKG